MWILGAVLNVGSMKMGYAWQEALSALDDPCEPHTHPIYRVRQWQIGVVLYVLGNILQFLSYAFAAQSLLLALSSAQFGTHLLFAWLMEGVNVPLRSMLGAGIIISFNILLVIFGSKSSQLMTAEELLQLFREPQYIAYQVIGAAACFCAAVAYVGTAKSTSSLSKRFPAIARMRPVLLAVASSIPGTQALLHSKCVATMFILSFGQANQMGHWFFWLAVFVQMAAAALWTAALTHGMTVFPTVIILPILQVVYTLVGIVCGTVFFQEWKDMSTLALCMYAIGFIGMVAGIRVGISAEELASGLGQLQEGDETDSEENVSDGASVGSSTSSGEQTRARRTTFAPHRTTIAGRKSINAALASTRSSMHATALSSLGLGNQKLRCTSVFVSPMALGASNFQESSNRRITMTQQAEMQQRCATLAKTAARKAQLAKGIPETSQDNENEDSLAPDWGGHDAVTNTCLETEDESAQHSSNCRGDSHKQYKTSSGEHASHKGGKGREQYNRSEHKASPLKAVWGLLKGVWRSSGDGSDREWEQEHVKNTYTGRDTGQGVDYRRVKKENGGKGSDRQDMRKRNEKDASLEDEDTYTGGEAIPTRDHHHFKESPGQASALAVRSQEQELTMQQISIGMQSNSTAPHQSPISYSKQIPLHEASVARDDPTVRSISQLDLAIRGSFTEYGQPYTLPGACNHSQVVAPNLDSQGTHQLFPSSQHDRWHAIREDAQQRHLHQIGVHSQLIHALGPGVPQSMSMQQQDMAARMRPVPHQAQGYEEGALLRATSQLPLLSNDLATLGLSSQTQLPQQVELVHSHLSQQPAQPGLQIPADVGSSRSSPWTSPSLSPAVTPVTSRAPSAGHLYYGSGTPTKGVDPAQTQDSNTGHYTPDGSIRSPRSPSPNGNTGGSKLQFSFSGAAHSPSRNQHTFQRTHLNGPPFQVANTNQEETWQQAGDHPAPSSAAVSLAGWGPPPAGSSPYASHYSAAHLHSMAMQQSVAQQRAHMGMHAHQHQDLGQFHPGTRPLTSDQHVWGQLHGVHSYNPIAMYSTPSSFTSVKSGTEAMRHPVTTVDANPALQTTNHNDNKASHCGVGREAAVMQPFSTTAHQAFPHSELARLHQLQMHRMQGYADQSGLPPGGPSGQMHAPQQQAQLQQLYQPRHYHGHLYEAAAGVGAPSASQPQTRTTSPAHGPQVALQQAATGSGSPRASAASMTSVIAHENVQDGGLTWLYSQFPR